MASVDNNIRKNLVSNIYIHSNEHNFYNYGGIYSFNSKQLPKMRYKEIETFYNELGDIAQSARTLEENLYNDLAILGISKQEFFTMFEAGVYNMNPNKQKYSQKEIYKIVSAEAAKLLNNKNFQDALAKVNEQEMKKEFDNYFKTMNDSQAKILFTSIGVQEYASNASLSRALEAVDRSLSNISSRQSISSFRQNIMNTKKASTKPVSAESWRKIVKEIKQRVNNKKKNMYFNPNILRQIDDSFNLAYVDFNSQTGLVLNNLSGYIKQWRKDCVQAIKEVTDKNVSRLGIDSVSQTEKHASGDSLEVSVDLVLEEKGINTIMIGGSKGMIEKRKHSSISMNPNNTNVWVRTGQNRTDGVIYIEVDGKAGDKKVKGKTHAYGFQAKNSQNITNQTFHIQNEIKLDTLLTTARQQGIIDTNDWLELFYVIGNLLWFENYGGQGGNNVSMEGSNARDVAFEYLEIIFMQVINILIEPQIAGYVNYTFGGKGKKLKQEFSENGLANVFFIIRDKPIPVSYFYESIRSFIFEEFLSDKKVQSNGVSPLLSFGKLGLAKKQNNGQQIKNMFTTYFGYTPDDLYEEKLNVLSKLPKDQFTGVYRYPNELVQIGRKAGENFINSAKITGVSVTLLTNELKKYYQQF